ncbi:type I restriction enzyme, S subunit [Marinagarivorans cellulosilyticus]|uniref:Type I restriction enzyme, S subunit n=2 Tax=Marinagarivorans cellulosilyticus TaxID=2721545 RepID=A0AAN2BLK2_9GAMM|nr:type I restriction enzyme, S subunit [Marinagarivorans cellulosilyticus]
MVALADLVDIRGGGTPSKKVAEYWGGSIPWASVKDFKSSELSITQDCITELGVKNSATNVLPAGTIVVPTRMALGKVAVTATNMAINQDLKALLVKDERVLDKRYLLRFLESKSDEIAKQGKGATVKGITLDVLRELDVYLPFPNNAEKSLKEQKRIAAILDKADAIRRKRQEAIQLADDFLRSVFLDMFGDPVSVDKVSFGDVVAIDAKMVDPREDAYIDLVHIGPDRIEKETGMFLPALTAREEGLISKKFLFDERHVLYSKIRPYLRKCALANNVGLCSADMYPIRAIDGKTTREFIWMLLLSEQFSHYTETLPDRASIPKLNRTELALFEFSLPKYESQVKFSKVVNSVLSMKSRYAIEVSKENLLFGSLSQKAFSGKL